MLHTTVFSEQCQVNAAQIRFKNVTQDSFCSTHRAIISLHAKISPECRAVCQYRNSELEQWFITVSNPNVFTTWLIKTYYKQYFVGTNMLQR